MVSVQAADLLMVLRQVPPGLTGAETAALHRLRTAAHETAAKPSARTGEWIARTEAALARFTSPTRPCRSSA